MERGPNTTTDGDRFVVAPRPSEGGWRGRMGHARIGHLLEQRTRFRLHACVATPELWICYWLAHTGEARRVVPMQCTVCGERPSAITLSNLVSSSKSVANCACSWKPRHATAEGRAHAEAAVAPRGYALMLGADEWVEAHRHRGDTWKFVHVRCVQCGTERHEPVRGQVTLERIGMCACRRKRAASREAVDEASREAVDEVAGEAASQDDATGQQQPVVRRQRRRRRPRPPVAPKHCTLEGRAAIVEALGEKPYLLEIGAADWEEAHRAPSEHWQFLALRCTNPECAAVRHVPVRSLRSLLQLGRCKCTNRGRHKRYQSHADRLAAEAEAENASCNDDETDSEITFGR